MTKRKWFCLESLLQNDNAMEGNSRAGLPLGRTASELMATEAVERAEKSNNESIPYSRKNEL